MHDEEFRQRLIARIKASDLWGSRARESGGKLSGLKCLDCGRSDAWAYADGPFLIICSHKSTCGARLKTLDLFPDLKENIEKEFAPTKEDPHRPAREYLYSRGLSSKSLDGLKFEYRRNLRKSGSGGVLFYVGINEGGEEVWNGRLFSPPPGVDKGHNQGKTVRMFWRHPGIEYDPSEPTYATEGLIDALSLIEMGFQAIAVLSSGQDPAKVELGVLAKNLVIAFDPDSAGAEGLKRWKAQFLKVDAIVPTRGDWNDLLREFGAQRGAEKFKKSYEEMRCRADLLLAPSAQDYARIYDNFYQRPAGLFVFGKKYYFSANGSAKNVSNFTLETDHFQLDTSNPENPTYRYFLRLYPAKGQPCCCSVSGADLSSPNAIRSAFLTTACVLWKGDQAPSAALASKIVDSTAPIVRQVHIVGHDRESGALVFPDFVIDKGGKMHLPDGKGVFRLSRREILRPPATEGQRDRPVAPKKGLRIKRIYDLIAAAWPDNGPLALAFTVASWFCRSVKPELGFFPFLSLHGDPQTGKSFLVRRLNAMQALDGEGLPMTKLNTGKGEIRELAKKSGLMIPLLEGNKEEKMRFDIESILTLYNEGNPLQVRAQKTNDLATRTVPFLATLCFVQNKEPFRTKAQMERVVSSRPFGSKDITSSTSLAFRELLKIPLREMAWVYIEVMSRRKEIEASWYDEFIRARDQIMDIVPDNRIAENHGLVLAFHRIAEKIFGAKNDLGPFVVQLAERKHRQCNHREATVADQFFDAVDDINPQKAAEFADSQGGRIFIHLSTALKTLDGNGFKFYGAQLQDSLREHPAFVVSNWNHRAYWGPVEATLQKSVKRTWVFDAAKMGAGLAV